MDLDTGADSGISHEILDHLLIFNDNEAEQLPVVRRIGAKTVHLAVQRG
jgi:hypothetical protein